ncbi:follistatin isoform X2 [Haematobia irritans]|uniref:follistatin isoform X2 n=1 Tax=Haematobia irritans TaxID=7368 RepID=UPI003F4F763F
MKYIRELAINPNVKRNHAKKYKHKFNIITFLKSNYKYKRRCSTIEKDRRLRRWRQVQLLPLFVEKVTNHHRIIRKIPLCTTKLSKFPRIFIVIKPSIAPPAWTAPPILSPAFDGWMPERPLTELKIAKASSLPGPANKNNVDADDHLVSIRRQCNAYKDANEDTIIDGDDVANANHRNDEWHYQRGNYDKVSTITSTPPLRCYRQQKQYRPSKPMSTMPVPYLVPSTTSGREDFYVRTGCCFTTMALHQNHIICNVVRTRESLQRQCQCLSGDNIDKDRIDCNNFTIVTSSTAHAQRCQSIDQQTINNNHKSNNSMSLFFTLFIAFAIGIRTAEAGACWQTVLGNGKCNEIFSFNISKSDCCGANQEFAYTEREPTNVEYFFATAIGGGMECTPCLESCRNVQCGPNKKCVKRKGRPKCVCAPECGAARRRRLQREQQLRQQHHILFSDDSERTGPVLANLQRSRQSRDTHSLSSEISKTNLGSGKQNQRKLIHIHMQQDYAHQQEAPPPPPAPSPKRKKQQQPKGNRRLLITANVEEHTEKPTTRRIQLFSNVRNTYARQRTNHQGNSQHEEDTDLSEEYEEDDYDDENGDEGSHSRGISFNSGFSFASSSSNANHNDEEDDAMRFGNQSPSRHKTKSNRNNHDLQTTKTQQRDQYLNETHNSNSHVRQQKGGGRHSENTPNRHRNNRHHNHNQHRHEHQHQKHKHRHRNRPHEDRLDPLHQEHHNKKNHRQPNSGLGRGKHDRHNHRKERPKVQKPPKNHKDHNTVITSTIATTSSIVNGIIRQSTNKTFTSPTSWVTTSTTTQSQFLSPTTPVNSSRASADTGGTSHQSRLTNRGSEIAASSSLPLSTTASSSSLSGPATAAASIHPHMQLQPSVAASTSSSVMSTYASSSALVNSNGGGANAVLQPPYTHHDHGGNFKTLSDEFQGTSTAVINSYRDDNDNTISTSHHFDSVSFETYFDQYDLHGFPKGQHGATITDSIRSSNPVCGTDGRTYNTECQLRKRSCRTDNPHLQVAYRGHCKTTCNGVKCLEGLTCVEDQYTMPHCIACKIECPLDDYDNGNDVVDATRAVCGADGKTYKSMCEINRIICKIGRSIGVAYPGPCREPIVISDGINGNFE